MTKFNDFNPPILIAILGATASGKSESAFKLAKMIDAEIFSLDSLSIYQGIDILSAKPSKEELKQIKHYAIDILSPNLPNNAALFHSLLKDAIKECKKPFLLITGGSSFYLKSIIDGLSPMPYIPQNIKIEVKKKIQNLDSAYQELKNIDPIFMTKINLKDTYRISRAFEIYLSTHQIPSQYFINNPPIPFQYQIHLYAIDTDRQILKEKIALRTEKMLESGAIKEMEKLLKLYPLESQPFKAIGPKECIAYISGEISLDECKHLIITHTNQLAKRQTTFNNTQFKHVHFLKKDELIERIYCAFKKDLA